jgi:arylformamidase
MVHDVSVLLRPGMPTWPGEEGACLKQVKHMARGDSANVRQLELGIHTGTHVDAPEHFVEGAATVEHLALEVLVGPCAVVDVKGEPDVSAVELEALFPAGRPVPERLLLRTRNSTGPSPVWAREGFQRDYAGIAHDAARWLVARGVRLVGVDYLSVEPFEATEPVTHRTLLGAGVVAIEGLDLRRTAPGTYRLCCLPILLQGAEGAPARVILES